MKRFGLVATLGALVLLAGAGITVERIQRRRYDEAVVRVGQIVRTLWQTTVVQTSPGPDGVLQMPRGPERSLMSFGFTEPSSSESFRSRSTTWNLTAELVGASSTEYSYGIRISVFQERLLVLRRPMIGMSHRGAIEKPLLDHVEESLRLAELPVVTLETGPE